MPTSRLNPFSPTVWWRITRFNGNANDESGNGHDGNAVNVALAADRFGVANKCYQFNGTNSHIDIGNSIQLGRTNDAMTISVWFLVIPIFNPQFDPAFQIITDYYGPDGHVGSGDAYFFASLYFDGPYQAVTNQVYFDNRSYPVSFENISHAVVNDNQWHSCVVVVDGLGTTKMYIDGVPNSQAAYDAALNYLDQQYWRIGACQWNNQIWNVLNGFIDDVRIYNRALSASEVQQLYLYEAAPIVSLLKAVKPAFDQLRIGTNYQLQVSSDLNSWTNQGAAFIATNSSMVWPQYFDVDNWNQLFFRLQVAP